MEKCLLLGNGGREAVLAECIARGYSLHAVLPYENPSIVEAVKKTNGTYIVGDPFNKEVVRNFIRENGIQVCVISSDNLLQDGLIDVAREEGLKTFGPTSKGSMIEWSKTYALDIVEKLAPHMMIKNDNIKTIEDLDKVMERYPDENFVVKPEGLTGGKGVKVGGVHFLSKEEGYEYAKSCLNQNGNVIVQDKVQGSEFTVMALTDGKHIVATPITFDYPYRFDEDKGPGTGGMGCMSFENGMLPFLEKKDIDECLKLIEDTIGYVNRDAMEFTGVIYGGFFKCEDGLKFIEFNARFGDPEAMNVLNLLETPFEEVLEHIFNGTLSEENCKFKKENSFLVYVVSKDYALRANSEPCVFELNTKGITDQGLKIYFANTKQIEGNTYTSVSNSRLFAVCTVGEDFDEIRAKVYRALDANVDKKLDYRNDIGSIYVH